MNTNWKELIKHEMKKHKETFEDVISSTLTEEELLKEFDDGYGCSEGEPFTLWTHKRTYFPVVYNRNEWCASVSRNPDEKPTYHIGG